jgi:glycerol transport system ATP-binding protein
MSLELRGVTRTVAGEVHVADVDLRLEAGTLNVLLGPTLSGKTSLMRLMAGLDRPTAGQIFMQGRDVTGVSVARRSVAMVYQQFINYPTFTVYENIASPLRVAGLSRADTDRAVRTVAELLQLTPLLARKPQELSGGQQQRTALARALVKKADLLLLDEPLANLDYKLREELRAELPRLFAETGAILVYATTEPQEALLLGGYTALLQEGRLLQYGPTPEVYRNPVNVLAGETFSDPPLNTAWVQKQHATWTLRGGMTISLPQPAAAQSWPDGPYRLGFRAHHLRLQPGTGAAVRLSAQVLVAEISGSDTYLHVQHDEEYRWVALIRGIHTFEPGQSLDLYLETQHMLFFTEAGQRVTTPPGAALTESRTG